MSRARVFVIVAAVCVLASAAAVVSAVLGAGQDDASNGAAAQLVADAHELQRPVLLFRSLSGSTRGEVGVAPISDPERATFSGLRCDRVYFSAGRGICVSRGGGFAQGYEVRVFDSHLKVLHAFGLEGTPSRARVSRDGKLGAVTMFVTGHAYAEAGTFSTATTLIDLRTGAQIANLEDFTVSRAGRVITAADVNYWGVTFAPDGDHFYATLATGGKTYLVRGSVHDRTMRTLHENVECPSLSPDGTRIAYKKRVGSGSLPWRLTVLDLKTMQETPLAERAGIDDQAEWEDNDHVLYGIGQDIRVVNADGSGQPRTLRAGANSPAVVR